MRIEKELAALEAANRQWTEQANRLYALQNQGIELERAGQPDAAAEAYEAAVAYGQEADRLNVNQYFYSLERLCVLYRKARRYDREIATIRTALAEYINDADRERLAARLVKAQALQDKQR